MQMYIIYYKEIWFICVDVVGLIICSLVVWIGYQHHRNQVRKMIDFKTHDQVNNPLSRMWTLILINLFCQTLQLIESLVFTFQPGGCQFTQVIMKLFQDVSADIILKFVFSFFSFHLSFICTVIVFHARRET